MNITAQVAALVSALVYLGAAPVEMVFFDRPAARRFLHVEADNIDDVRMWAFVVGFRNMLAGLGAIIGLIIWWAADDDGARVAGHATVVTACCYMVLASLAMGLADLLGLWRPRGGSILGTIASTLPPLVALLAMLT